nr:G protein-coupled receptor [Proales similis]
MRANNESLSTSMSIETNMTESEPEDAGLRPFLVEYYTFPVIVLLGTVCNSLAFIVLRGKKMRSQSTYFYMAVLAVADEMVLINGCLNFWLYLYFGKTFLMFSVLSCKFASFALYAALHFSVWTVVIMTVERFIAVTLPLKAGILCTVKRAKLAILTLFAIIVLVNIHFFVTHSLVEIQGQVGCLPESSWANYFMEGVWPWIDASIYSYVPLSLLIVFNVMIIHNLVKASNKMDKMNEAKRASSTAHSNYKLIYRSKQRDANTSPTEPAGNNQTESKSIYQSSQQINQANQSNSSANRKLTIMLLVVSMTFLVTSMPIVTLQTIELTGRLEQSTTLTVIRGIFLSLQYLNHSINFFLYGIFCTRFRREFLDLFNRCTLKSTPDRRKAANWHSRTAANTYKAVQEANADNRSPIRPYQQPIPEE